MEADFREITIPSFIIRGAHDRKAEEAANHFLHFLEGIWMAIYPRISD
jgi:hypothetical protein